MTSPRLFLFDINARGHHAAYIAHIMRAWRREGRGELVAGVSPAMLRENPELANEAFEGPDGAARLEVIPGAEYVPASPLLAKGLGERLLLKRYVERLQPERVLLMFADHTQFALATRIRFSYPVDVSMLLLRVSHHRERHRAESLRSRITQLRKRLVLRAAVRNPHTDCVFSGDATAADAIRELVPSARAYYLPDPVAEVAPAASPERTREAYGVPQGRKLVLLFGVLAQRKGVLKVLEALLLLPPDAQQQVALVLAGPVENDIAGTMPPLLEQVQLETEVSVTLRDAFLHEQDIKDLMEAADLVLVPYQLHAGTSSVLIRAAGAARPVLAQDYGWIRQHVQEHHLGRLVDSTSPQALAEGIDDFLRHPEAHFDATRARAFAATQTPETYTDTLFHHLGLR